MTESPAQDDLLALLVHTINRSTGLDARATVTLTVGGLVLAGDVIPTWMWFREMRTLLSDGEGESADSFATFFGSVGDNALGGLLIEEATGEGGESLTGEDQDLPTTIHLARTEVLGRDQVRTELGGGLWRGQLRHVTGWAFGRQELE